MPSLSSYLRVYFNPRPPWGGRLWVFFFEHFLSNISIHALRGEGDGDAGAKAEAHSVISIHALRGEGDKGGTFSFYTFGISIHALRGEGDGKKAVLLNDD